MYMNYRKQKCDCGPKHENTITVIFSFCLIIYETDEGKTPKHQSTIS